MHWTAIEVKLPEDQKLWSDYQKALNSLARGMISRKTKSCMWGKVEEDYLAYKWHLTSGKLVTPARHVYQLLIPGMLSDNNKLILNDLGYSCFLAGHVSKKTRRTNYGKIYVR